GQLELNVGAGLEPRRKGAPQQPEAGEQDAEAQQAHRSQGSHETPPPRCQFCVNPSVEPTRSSRLDRVGRIRDSSRPYAPSGSPSDRDSPDPVLGESPTRRHADRGEGPAAARDGGDAERDWDHGAGVGSCWAREPDATLAADGSPRTIVDGGG